MWGPRTGLRCYDCGYNVHERCRDKAPKTCTKFKAPNMQKDPTTDNFPGLEPETSRPDIMVVGPRPDDENSQIIYQGYLYKQVKFEIRIKSRGWSPKFETSPKSGHK